ncbi:Methyltransferase trt5 [Hyphodiscus hymeniophilus]|uniref:Methyltransferase trt5 n=1 Tax=Hyphodiscus hymeniophilus TaxID=353542 RepID=A0A9P7AZ16_9HELO|nr:Methyltransferase trt5 [Hyphodiscus hymeniophilus]
MATTSIPSSDPQAFGRSKDVSSYRQEPGEKLGALARELLEDYSKVSPEEVESHVKNIRDEAWDIFPYPCIGGFRFLDLAIATTPEYPAIIERLKTGNETFLDLGCCFGQELRRVAFDGAPTESLYGCDLRPEFFDLGYKLFRDKETLKSKFLAVDIFDSSSALSSLYGKVDIIYAGSFLHLFEYAKQVEVCKQIVKLLKDTKGSLLLGRQVGNLDAGNIVRDTNTARTVFSDADLRIRHNNESFKNMWDEVGEATGTKWRVETEMKEIKERFDAHGPNVRRLRFAVFRE